MTLISTTLPTVGQDRGTEEVDVLNALNTAISTVNGSLDTANFATSAKPVTLLGQYHAITDVAAQCNDANTSGVKLFVFGGLSPSGSAFGTGPIYIVGLDPADYAVSGLTAKMRVRAAVATNTVAPGITFTFGLYPITVAGAADTITPTAGTVVTGSTAAIASPGSSSLVQAVSSDFTPPSAGVYALGVNLSAGLAGNNSFQMLYARLGVHHV